MPPVRSSLNNGQRRRFWPRLWRWGLLAIGLIFLLIGVFQGGALDVLQKSVLICFQCIGIG